MESSQAPRDRRHGSRALLERAQREQQSYKAKDGGGRPGVVVKRAEGESREADGEDRAHAGTSGHNRRRTNCPPPWSSTPMSSRAAPKNPHRTSKSQRSCSPPRSTQPPSV